MTANPEITEPLPGGLKVGSRVVEQLGIGAPPGSAFRVVSADGSTAILNRPELSLGSSHLPIPPSSADIATLSGSLDLSSAPAGLKRPGPGRSYCPPKPDDDRSRRSWGGVPTALLDACGAPATGRRASHIEKESAAIDLQGHLKLKTDDGGAPTVGRVCADSVCLQHGGHSSIEMRRTGFDYRLARTIDAWPSLPVHVRETIVTIIEATLNG